VKFCGWQHDAGVTPTFAFFDRDSVRYLIKFALISH
jgi:hypothetical protein